MITIYDMCNIKKVLLFPFKSLFSLFVFEILQKRGFKYNHESHFNLINKHILISCLLKSFQCHSSFYTIMCCYQF